jgi:hypothetical protein
LLRDPQAAKAVIPATFPYLKHASACAGNGLGRLAVPCKTGELPPNIRMPQLAPRPGSDRSRKPLHREIMSRLTIGVQIVDAPE